MSETNDESIVDRRYKLLGTLMMALSCVMVGYVFGSSDAIKDNEKIKPTE